MKKVGILTHYNVNNQGAQLQLFGLYSELKKYCFPVVVRFEKSYEDAERDAEKRNNIRLSSVPYIVKEYILKRGIPAFWVNFAKYIEHKRFIKDHYKLVKTNDALDAVVVGSDEVYSIVEGYNEVMYGYGLNTKFLASYAPSFGQTTMELIEERKVKLKIANGLLKYQMLSARDLRTKEIIKELTGRDAAIVCDPAILHDFSHEIQKCSLPKKRYMVVYSYDRNMNSPEEITAIKSFAKKRQLRIVSAGTYHKWCDECMPCNCLEWLYVIKNAELVITDTFHGCIASLIEGKEVAIVVRSINTNKLGALMETVGIEDRQIIDITTELELVFSKKMDYASINKRIGELRSIGKEYLSKIICLINSNEETECAK